MTFSLSTAAASLSALLLLVLSGCNSGTVKLDDTADTSATDSGDSTESGDSTDSGDSADTSDTADTADTSDTSDTADTADTSDTSETGDSGGDTGSRYHPEGYDSSRVHGMDAKYQRDTCLDCHGADGEGGTSGVSCDDCHDEGWRSDCTFCHGGSENSTGAPPEDIDNEDTGLSFPEHTVHVTETIHTAWDCEQCHTNHSAPFEAGHFLVEDSTPGVAELMFSAGLSPRGTYSAGTCSNVYCHGNGQGSNTGTAVSGSSYDCDSCHRESGLSGHHADHLRERLNCSECHSDTVDSSETVIGPAFHVDGDADVNLPDGMTYGSTCNGSCHGENHSNRRW